MSRVVSIRLNDDEQQTIKEQAVGKESPGATVKRLAFALVEIERQLGGEKYRTKSGKVLTDKDFEALADEAERGYNVSKIVERRRSTTSLVDGSEDRDEDGDEDDALSVADKKQPTSGKLPSAKMTRERRRKDAAKRERESKIDEVEVPYRKPFKPQPKGKGKKK